jgi:hemerythrin-like domain-containing protein
MNRDRRGFLVRTGGMGLVGAAAVGLGGSLAAADQAGGKKKAAGADEDVAPPEDLMREHGVLNRILLIYEEAIRRAEAKQPFPTETVASAAGIIRRFIEQYHEKLEEDHLFPRFEKAHKLVDLVATLRRQHQAGRKLTDRIVEVATPAGMQAAGNQQNMLVAMRSFIRMYRPHEAREDTILFPALRSIVPPKEFAELGEQFEAKEHELFGKEGFEGIVVQVGKLEQAVGIYDLDQFTPRG